MRLDHANGIRRRTVAHGADPTRPVAKVRGRLVDGWLAVAMLVVLAVSSFAIVAPAVCAKSSGPVAAGAAAYLDLLDFHGMPGSPEDRSFNIFFDDGAWQGYSLPSAEGHGTGFVGPFVQSLGSGHWVGREFAQLSLREETSGVPVPLGWISDHSAPGYLARNFAAPGLHVSETLFFVNSCTALVRIEMTSEAPRKVAFAIDGRLMPGQSSTLMRDGDAVVQTFAHSDSRLITRLHLAGADARSVAVSGNGYHIAPDRPLHLQPRRPMVVYVVQTFLYDEHTASPKPVDFATAWARNRERWNGYLRVASRAHLEGLPDAIARHVVVKAMETMLGNWRAPRGSLHHAGVIPSYSNPDFNGFWAWDSWKHAAALALFAPRLAREQMLTMFDYQNAQGMIPDCVFLDKSNDNWRDTKPPLATWAAMRIYRATGDKDFLSDLYPKLIRYHDWWFSYRDHAHDGLAEYGSTDGTTQAAKWESGMDDAARFDDVKMLKNGKDAWSMDQESVDLNAYLYRDAKELAEAAAVLGKKKARREWLQRAATLRAKVQSRFFDKSLGYFFDVSIPDNHFVTTYGPEGWIPLWAGAATSQQADAIARVVSDPRKFATFMPFPTLAADDPRFAPVKGYWRGPVWLDQAYFGVRGLQRYGHLREADRMALQLVVRAQGLTGQAPIRENYDPLNGHGLNSRNFSWSAASYILLLLGQHESEARGAHALH